MMASLAKREKRSIEQQASMIIMNFFKDYKHILEFENEKDFGFITEDKLREILQKEERYWKEVMTEDFTTDGNYAAAVAAHAEEMRLERISVIMNDDF